MKRMLQVASVVVAAALAGLLAVRLASAVNRSTTPPPPRSAFDPALGHNLADHWLTTVGGQQWSLTSFDNDFGQRCEGINVPGRGAGIGCIPSSAQFADSPVVVHLGSAQDIGGDRARWDMEWLWGRADRDIARIDLTLTDCEIVHLPLDNDGYFLYVVAPAQIEANVGPGTLAAFDIRGERLIQKSVTLDAPTSPGNVPIPGAITPAAPNC
jgi:hypothetical protein